MIATRSTPTFFLALACLFVSSLAFAWTGKVVSVADGDTISILRDGQQVKIRLYGIDCPEKAQSYGQKAREMTASMVAGRIIDVEVKDTDRYGRSVALVSLDGSSLNETIVRNGYAWVYRQYCKERFCSNWIDLESMARQQQKGMWEDPHIVPPWDWRHSERRQQVAEPRLISNGEGQFKQKEVTGVFHGNVKSHKFHQPGCQHYNCKNCSEVFKSREDAISTGYSACEVCRP